MARGVLGGRKAPTQVEETKGRERLSHSRQVRQYAT